MNINSTLDIIGKHVLFATVFFLFYFFLFLTLRFVLIISLAYFTCWVVVVLVLTLITLWTNEQLKVSKAGVCNLDVFWCLENEFPYRSSPSMRTKNQSCVWAQKHYAIVHPTCQLLNDMLGSIMCSKNTFNLFILFSIGNDDYDRISSQMKGVRLSINIFSNK